MSKISWTVFAGFEWKCCEKKITFMKKKAVWSKFDALKS